MRAPKGRVASFGKDVARLWGAVCPFAPACPWRRSRASVRRRSIGRAPALLPVHAHCSPRRTSPEGPECGKRTLRARQRPIPAGKGTSVRTHRQPLGGRRGWQRWSSGSDCEGQTDPAFTQLGGGRIKGGYQRGLEETDSNRETTTAPTKSPVTLSVVRHMSRNRSTPRINPSPSTGT